MTDYSQLKVTELRELLKSRGMATSGTKADIISRLKANDSNAGPTGVVTVEEEKEEPEKEDDLEAAEQSPAQNKEENVVPIDKEAPNVTANSSTNTTEVASTTSATEEPHEDADQLIATKTAEVVEELKKRIERSKRFGEPDQEAIASLKRVEKFGLQGVHRANKILGDPVTQQSNNDRRRHHNNNNRHNGGQRRNNNHRGTNTSGRVEKTLPTETPEKLKKRRERFAS